MPVAGLFSHDYSVHPFSAIRLKRRHFPWLQIDQSRSHHFYTRGPTVGALGFGQEPTTVEMPGSFDDYVVDVHEVRRTPAAQSARRQGLLLCTRIIKSLKGVWGRCYALSICWASVSFNQPFAQRIPRLRDCLHGREAHGGLTLATCEPTLQESPNIFSFIWFGMVSYSYS